MILIRSFIVFPMANLWVDDDATVTGDLDADIPDIDVAHTGCGDHGALRAEICAISEGDDIEWCRDDSEGLERFAGSAEAFSNGGTAGAREVGEDTEDEWQVQRHTTIATCEDQVSEYLIRRKNSYRRMGLHLENCILRQKTKHLYETMAMAADMGVRINGHAELLYYMDGGNITPDYASDAISSRLSFKRPFKKTTSQARTATLEEDWAWVKTSVTSDVIARSATEGFDILCPPELIVVMDEKMVERVRKPRDKLIHESATFVEALQSAVVEAIRMDVFLKNMYDRDAGYKMHLAIEKAAKVIFASSTNEHLISEEAGVCFYQLFLEKFRVYTREKDAWAYASLPMSVDM